MDTLLSVVFWAVLLLLPCIALKRLGWAEVNWGWLGTALLLLLAYLLLVRDAPSVVYSSLGSAAGPYNWLGKTAALLLVAAAVFSLNGRESALSPRAMGFTFAQRNGSLIPASLVCVMALAFSIGLEVIVKNNGSANAGFTALFYKGFFHGFDEELFFRGVFLAVLAMGISSRGVNVLGANITWAGLFVIAIYSFMHGLNWQGAAPVIGIAGIALLTIYGSIFLWLRERTGSLLMPVVAHTLCNTAAQLF